MGESFKQLITGQTVQALGNHIRLTYGPALRGDGKRMKKNNSEAVDATKAYRG